MKTYVFGYASLINLGSAAKTLRRPISDEELRLVCATGFSRVWRLVVPVRMGQESGRIVNAVFLDIEDCQDSDINGVLIEVNEEELKNFDIREASYNRIDITPHISPRVEDGLVFTYQGKQRFFSEHYENPVVLDRYVAMVTSGVRYWGKEFAIQFDASTQSCPYPILPGVYQFCDDMQNLLTGHDE